MSNGIQKRQNEENSLLELAAQRQIYREAKQINKIIFACSVIIPFGLSIISLFINEVNWRLYTKIISFVSWCLALFLGMNVKKVKSTAAMIQQQFDVYVFSMNWDEKLFRKNKNLDDIISIKAQKLLKKKSIDEEKLRDWYRKEVDQLPLEKAIKLCQEENVNWDASLRKVYSIASLVIVIILLIIIGLIGKFSNEVLYTILAYGVPIIQWEIKTLAEIKLDIERLNKLSDDIKSSDKSDMKLLMEIQRDIYEHRKNCYLIGDVVNNFLKSRLEEQMRNRANFEIHKK
jgi:hypothetical protein